MAAHRAWRVLCRRNAGNGSFTGVTEIEMATSAAGSDVTSTSFAIGSGSYQAGAATDAFDNDFTGDVLQWNGTGSGVWVGQDFGAGNEKDIVEVRIRPNKDAANRTFGYFEIQYSDDWNGSTGTWTTAWYCYNVSWSVGTSVTFTLPTAAAHRYWRVRPTAIMSYANESLSCAELAMRETVGGSNALSGGTLFASSTNGSFPLANAIDGNNSTFWTIATSFSGNVDFIGYDFGSGVTKTIVEVAWTPRNDSTHWRQVPLSGRIESSPDGRSWISRFSYADACFRRNYATILTDPASVVAGGSSHRYWGIKTTATQSTAAIGLAEMEMRSLPNGSDECTGGTAITNNDFGELIPNLFDNSNSSEYASTNLPAIAAYDFGSGNAKNIVQFWMRARTNGGFNNHTQGPGDFEVIYADANGQWQTHPQGTYTGQTWTSSQERAYTFGSSGRRRMSFM